MLYSYIFVHISREADMQGDLQRDIIRDDNESYAVTKMSRMSSQWWHMQHYNVVIVFIVRAGFDSHLMINCSRTRVHRFKRCLPG